MLLNRASFLLSMRFILLGMRLAVVDLLWLSWKLEIERDIGCLILIDYREFCFDSWAFDLDFESVLYFDYLLLPILFITLIGFASARFLRLYTVGCLPLLSDGLLRVEFFLTDFLLSYLWILSVSIANFSSLDYLGKYILFPLLLILTLLLDLFWSTKSTVFLEWLLIYLSWLKLDLQIWSIVFVVVIGFNEISPLIACLDDYCLTVGNILKVSRSAFLDFYYLDIV